MSIKNSKLLELFLGLSQSNKNLRDFAKYLQGPFVTQSPRIISLFQYLKNNKDRLNDKNLKEERIFQQVISKEESFDRQKLKDVMSNLSKIIEQFLTNKKLEERAVIETTLLAESFRDRKMDTLFFNTINRAITLANKEPIPSKHLYLSELNYKFYDHPHANQNAEPQRHKVYLKETIDHLDTFYIINKLKYSCEVLIRQRIYNETWEDPEFKNKLNFFIEHMANDALPLIKAFRIAAKTLLNPTEQGYWTFKNYCKKHKEAIRPEGITLFRLLTNVLFSVKIKNGRLVEFFDLYKFGLDEDFLVHSNYMNVDDFNNIIHISYRLGEFKWAENFITNYIDYLPGHKERINIEKFYKSYIYFGQQKYLTVIDTLEEIKYVDFSYGIRKHVLMLKSIYELRNTEDTIFELKSSCITYRGYLYRNRKRIGKSIKVANENFIKILLRIYEAPYIDVQKQDLLAELAEVEGAIVEDTWLKEKIIALKIR